MFFHTFILGYIFEENEVKDRSNSILKDRMGVHIYYLQNISCQRIRYCQQLRSLKDVVVYPTHLQCDKLVETITPPQKFEGKPQQGISIEAQPKGERVVKIIIRNSHIKNNLLYHLQHNHPCHIQINLPLTYYL